ncbi:MULTISPECIES: DUF3566 domain-containing protein [Streptomyces]|uniref:DUF3566 domain-containing protein n=1 Tax=Streptomyces bangladeshensis TaxID=295352 RepID=A0ABP5N2M4_9ACTN|nr:MULTISPECIES: DUF3566 domain-containing protein [unclassified Streptomyces]OYP16553.1 hypothetical protein CFC35_20265 [Streptomyces sp. FBKL.4005]BCM68057.1 hypothetical protein EASAB2608_03391 [Streptomyces sp. EAS-AB2608]CUW29100.1 hypothetical protein TUE45_03837 [Streptomyces reticuli]
MSGATGAGSAGTSTGTETDGGGRGSAARAGSAGRTTDPHTTNLKPVKASVADSSGTPETEQESQGGTVTDTRGQAAAGETRPASPLPGERRTEQPAGPYHPPQAYPAQAPADAVRKPRTGVRPTAPRTRKARLRVAKADPWSVMKVSFLLSIAFGICTIVASAVLWMVMDAMGVFSTVGGTISEATGSNEANGFDLQAFLSLPHVLTFTTIIAVIDVVLATALATLGAFIYNLSAGFVGGVELTLAEDE